jgi:hypothetical protein
MFAHEGVRKQVALPSRCCLSMAARETQRSGYGTPSLQHHGGAAVSISVADMSVERWN